MDQFNSMISDESMKREECDHEPKHIGPGKVVCAKCKQPCSFDPIMDECEKWWAKYKLKYTSFFPAETIVEDAWQKATKVEFDKIVKIINDGIEDTALNSVKIAGNYLLDLIEQDKTNRA